MAFKRRRTQYRRRHRRKALTKRQVRAVQSLVLKPVETKHSVSFNDIPSVLLVTGFSTGNSWWFTNNIYAPIKRGDNPSVTDSNHNVEGDTFHSIGMKVWIDCATVSSAATTPVYACKFRFTVYRENTYTTGFQHYGNTVLWDGEFGSTPTTAHWDMEKADIIFSRSWTSASTGGPSGITDKTFWVPLKGKRVCTLEESASGTVDELQGWQYYYALEIYQPGATSISSSVLGSISTKVYWKDP